MAALFARLNQIDSQLAILPSNDHPEEIPISSDPNVPTNMNDFHKYFSAIFANVQSTKRLAEIKFSPFLLNSL